MRMASTSNALIANSTFMATVAGSQNVPISGSSNNDTFINDTFVGVTGPNIDAIFITTLTNSTFTNCNFTAMAAWRREGRLSSSKASAQRATSCSQYATSTTMACSTVNVCSNVNLLNSTFANNTIVSNQTMGLCATLLFNSTFVNNTFISGTGNSPEEVYFSGTGGGNLFYWNNFSTRTCFM